MPSLDAVPSRSPTTMPVSSQAQYFCGLQNAQHGPESSFSEHLLSLLACGDLGAVMAARRLPRFRTGAIQSFPGECRAKGSRERSSDRSRCWIQRIELGGHDEVITMETSD